METTNHNRIIVIILAIIVIAAGAWAYAMASTSLANKAFEASGSPEHIEWNTTPFITRPPVEAENVSGADAYLPPAAPDPVRPTGSVYDEYFDVEKKPSPAEVAAVATDSGTLLHSWEVGYVQQKEKLMKSYGVYDPREYSDNEWLTWQQPAPGMAVIMANPKTGKKSKCTINSFITSNSRVYAVTAGHCGDEGYTDVYYKLANEPNMRAFGEVVKWQRRGRPASDETFSFETDVAFIRVNNEVVPYVTPLIANKLEVERIMPASEVKPGMVVCKFGYRTQESCGSIIAVNDSMVSTHLFSLAGDSGSPLYVYTDPDNYKVALVGILSGSPTAHGQQHDFITEFALAGPALSQNV